MMPPTGRENCQGLPPDVVSDLPDNVIDVILMRLPCKEAVRTSVLSRKWRYHWCRLAKWEFDKSLWSTQKDKLYPTVKLRKIVYQLLTHHEGPITKFTLTISYLEKCPKIDNFIYFLSRKGIQHLVLHLPQYELYELPSSLFLCSQLRHLNLDNCSIHHPSLYEGFDRLVSLELCRVTISSELLGSLISHCPLLEQLVLKFSKILNITEINAPMLRSFDFTGSVSSICLKNVPLLAKVSLKCDSSSREPEKFDFAKFFESCSVLEQLLLNFGYSEVYEEADRGIQKSFELERFSHVTFNHLKKVKLVSFGGTTHEMQLIKLLLANSPVLVKMKISPSFLYDTTPETLAELSKFRPASPKAEIDIKYYGKLKLNVDVVV